MADVYGNPYLPSFVRNQPKMTNPTYYNPGGVLPTKAAQITSVQGFAGARQHVANLTPGSSEIIAESDKDLARVYVTAVDQNGQPYVQGFDLIPVEEPKAVTMDDLNEKMNKVLNRLDQPEQERMAAYDQPVFRHAGQDKPAGGNAVPSSRGAQSGTGSDSRALQNGGNKSSDETGD
jgi:hypothetical protein